MTADHMTPPADSGLVLPAPSSTATGPLIDIASALATTVLPAGAQLVRAEEFPVADAAIVKFHLGDDWYRISIQRPKFPASIAQMTGSATSTAQALPTGSTRVDIIGADYEQVVLIRPSGLTIAASRTGSKPVAAVPSPMAPVSVALLASSLVTAADNDLFDSTVP